MKDYQRVTPRDKVEMLNFNGASESMTRFYNYAIRCHDLEDKIERGELCDREEVRKETAREIVEMLIGHEMESEGWTWIVSQEDVAFIAEKYGIELFGKTEQVEDEE